MEQLKLSTLLTACHFWDQANHALRCALEHTLMSIWITAHPIDIDKQVGKDITISDIQTKIFSLPSFKLYNTIVEDHLKINLKHNYEELSTFVHSSNVHMRSGEERPHVTLKFAKNPGQQKKTMTNLTNTFELIIILLAITYESVIKKEDAKKIKSIVSKNTKESIGDFLIKIKM